MGLMGLVGGSDGLWQSAGLVEGVGEKTAAKGGVSGSAWSICEGSIVVLNSVTGS